MPRSNSSTRRVAGSGGGEGSGSGVCITQEVTREGEETALGDGGGVLLVAESDAGRLWGASALWERGVPAGSAGRQAAEELLEVLASGACVDQWWVDSAGCGPGRIAPASAVARLGWPAGDSFVELQQPQRSCRALAPARLTRTTTNPVFTYRMQDQLIIWMALAGGTSRLVCAEPTLHTRTAIVVAQQLLSGARFTVTAMQPQHSSGGDGAHSKVGAGQGSSGSQQLYHIECQGAGIQAS